MDALSNSFSPRINLRNVVFFSTTPIAAAVLVPFYLYQQGWHWSLFALFLVSTAITMLSITAGYHRYLSHRSYEARTWVKLGYLLFGAAAFQGSALQWASDHRRHHRFVDTDRDPHDINRGFLWAHLTWLFYEEAAGVANKYPPDLANDKLLQWQARYYSLIAFTTGFGLPVLAGWAIGLPFGGLVFGGFLRVVCSNHSTFLINSLAHTFGGKPYSDSQTARDSMLMAFLAFGEGYHNYHHRFQSDYRNGIRWYHWDPTKWLIQLLSLPGWTYRLKAISAAEILRARLHTEEKQFIEHGVPVERVASMKTRVEEAQKQWRSLCDDYQLKKRNVQQQSRRHLAFVRAEIKIARLEFKIACRQWSAYRRMLRFSPSISG